MNFIEIDGLKVAPDGSKSYAKPIKSPPGGGAGGDVTGKMLICSNRVPFAVGPIVPDGILRLTRPSADVSVTDWVNMPWELTMGLTLTTPGEIMIGTDAGVVVVSFVFVVMVVVMAVVGVVVVVGVVAAVIVPPPPPPVELEL